MNEETAQDDPQIYNTLESELVILHLTTLTRLFEAGADACLLYLFYCHTAKLQSNKRGRYTNTVKANKEYCRKGLAWGSEKFYKAKNILLQKKSLKI
jgi:hypothetical protein